MRLPLRSGNDRQSSRSLRSVRPFRRRCFGGAVFPESLEARRLLSAIVVTNTHDSGRGSLRSAVAAADDGQTIRFASQLSGRTISLRSPVDITKNLTIAGPMNGKVTLNGGGRTRVLEIDGGTVQVSHLVIAQGAAAAGGGILDNGGTLTIRDSRLTANVAYGSATTISQGGAIAQIGGHVTLVRDVLTGNRVVGNPQSPVIFPPPMNPPSGCIGCIVISIEILPAPIDYAGEADGGAVSDSGGGLTVRDSRLTDNRATGVVPGASLGGDAYGGAVFVDNGQLQSNRSTFAKDWAVGGGVVNTTLGPSDSGAPGSASGGGIAVASSSAILAKTTIRLDVAQGGQGQSLERTAGSFGGTASGGGVYASGTSDLSVIGGAVTRDAALGGEGSVATYPDPMSGDEIPGGGGAVGGGIASSGSDVSLSRATLSHDTAHGGDAPDPSASGFNYLAGDAWGGALDFEGTEVGDLSVSRTVLRDNSTSGGNAEQSGSAVGGALSIEEAQSVAISKSLIEGNRAANALPYNPTSEMDSQDNNSANGGGVYVSYVVGSFNMTDTRVVGNQAGGAGNSVVSGGGLFVYDAQVILANDRLQSNKAVSGPMVANRSPEYDEPVPPTVPLESAMGGAVAYLEEGARDTMTVADSQFIGNIAMSQASDQEDAPANGSLGGAIANLGGTISIAGGSFVANRAIGLAGSSGAPGADSEGGAIYSLGAPTLYLAPGSSLQEPSTPSSFLTAAQVTFRKNQAVGGGTGQGGAIYNDQYSELALTASTVVANRAIAGTQGSGQGGGLYLAAISTNLVQTDQIARNQATTAGSQVEQVPYQSNSGDQGVSSPLGQ
jgi:hypothetical protein